MKKNILISGIPKSGKSTLLLRLISDFKNGKGIVAKEQVMNGERCGFEIITDTGKTFSLASTEKVTDVKVSKYYVDLVGLESSLGEISNFKKENIVYIDEIGEMQLNSEKFIKSVEMFLNSSNIFIGTISEVFTHPFITKIKNRDDVIIVNLKKGGIDKEYEFISELIKKIKKASIYATTKNRFKYEEGRVILSSEHGERILKKSGEIWSCSCNFYKRYNICSHVIALEEVLKLT